jgi:hypothetical protein
MAEHFPQMNEDEMQKLLENSTPKNTKRITQYGMKIFNGM